MDFAVKQEGGVRSEKILSLGKNAAYFSYDSQGVENRGSEQRTPLEAPCVFHVEMRVFNTLNAWSAQNADFRGHILYEFTVTFLIHVFSV